MLYYLSESITDFLLLRKIIRNEDKEIYIYGIQLLISSIINALICLIESLLLGDLIGGLVFFLTFSSLRKFTGGFHSKSYLLCNVIFSIIAAVALTVNKFIYYIFMEIPVIALVMLFTILCITLFAPVYNENKKLTNNERNKFRIISILIYLVHMGLYFTVFVIFNIGITIIPICDLIVAIMIIWGIFNNKLHVKWHRDV